MLSFNDAIAHQPELVQCTACDTNFPVEQAYWYEDAASMVFDGTQPVVPICPPCHIDPTSWLQPVYSVPGYLARRICEGLDS